MFVGRKRELEKLNEMYTGNQFEFAVIYGRRRVGKTTLINKFCEDKKSIYYMAIEGLEKDNLTNFTKSIFDVMLPGAAMPAFQTYEELFSYIDTIAEERIIIAIDEYPYMAEGSRSISSILQAHIDHRWKESKLFLILCGSSMSFMENQVLGYKSPLYGRRTAQFKIQPFTFFEAKAALKDFDSFSQVLLYGVTGGIPEYMSRINRSKSVDENIVNLFFESSGRLFEEPTNLMKQELRNFATYNSVVSAIASGASRMNDIATKVGEDSAACTNQIKTLMALGVVRKEFPSMEAETSRKTIYSLEDSMFIFWYRFVLPNISNIARGLGQQVYDSNVKPLLNDFLGLIFKRICIQYMYQKEVFEKAPFCYGTIGRWWGNNPHKRCQEEIDLVAGDKQNILLGECKWRNEKINIQVLRDLQEQAKLFHQENQWLYLFSKTGFTRDVIQEAEKNDHIILVKFDDMVRVD